MARHAKAQMKMRQEEAMMKLRSSCSPVHQRYPHSFPQLVMDGEKTLENIWDSEIFRVPPRFSTIRVNTLVTNADTVEAELKEYLKERAPDCVVGRHPVLPELLVVEAPRRGRPASAGRQLVVDASCGAALLRGADLYAPGVLACPADVQEGDVVSVVADLEGRCLRGRTQQYDGKQLFVGNGVMQLSRRSIFTAEDPSGVAVRMTEPVSGCPSLGPFCGRRCFLQNLPSALAARVLRPRPGQLVLDMCAAPGGKATHLAQLMQNQGLLYAVDKTAAKVSRISSLAARLGVTCLLPVRADSRHLLSAGSDCRLRQRHLAAAACPRHGAGPCLPPLAPAAFDCVLLDAPCSGLGRRPRLGPPPSTRELTSYPALQRALLLAAADAVRPGGALVYSTCTLPEEENERQVAALLAARPEMSLVPAEPRLAGPGRAGAGLDDRQRAMVMRFEPEPGAESCDADTIGFFIARMVKRES